MQYSIDYAHSDCNWALQSVFFLLCDDDVPLNKGSSRIIIDLRLCVFSWFEGNACLNERVHLRGIKSVFQWSMQCFFTVQVNLDTEGIVLGCVCVLAVQALFARGVWWSRGIYWEEGSNKGEGAWCSAYFHTLPCSHSFCQGWHYRHRGRQVSGGLDFGFLEITRNVHLGLVNKNFDLGIGRGTWIYNSAICVKRSQRIITYQNFQLEIKLLMFNNCT